MFAFLLFSWNQEAYWVSAMCQKYHKWHVIDCLPIGCAPCSPLGAVIFLLPNLSDAQRSWFCYWESHSKCRTEGKQKQKTLDSNTPALVPLSPSSTSNFLKATQFSTSRPITIPSDIPIYTIYAQCSLIKRFLHLVQCLDHPLSFIYCRSTC